MNNLLKNTVKFAVGTSLTLGAVAVGASAVAASSVGRVISAGAKAAKDAIKEELSALKSNAVAASTEISAATVEQSMFAEVEEAAKEK